MSDYLNRADLLAALTNTHERTITPVLFGGKAILIREITARQRMLANSAALADNPDEPDQALYRAMLIQMSVVDAATGTAGADGRIDPRTRTPIFAIEDIQSIADGRDIYVDALLAEILRLAALRPEDMFRGDTASDGSERSAGAGREEPEEAPGGDEGQGLGAADGGVADAGDDRPSDGGGVEQDT